MVTLKEARRKGEIAQFAKEHRHDPKGNMAAFNETLKAMAGKSKAVPATSSKRNPDD